MIGRATETTGFISLTFLADGGPNRDLEFVVDTGFEGGGLTLPPGVIDSLGLKLVIDTRAEMADGTEIVTNVYQGSIVGMQRETDVAVYALGSRPLLGTGMLTGRRLTMDFVKDGALSIVLS